MRKIKMIHGKAIGIAVACVVVAVSLMAAVGILPTAAQSAYSVSIVPAAQTVLPEETFFVDVVVDSGDRSLKSCHVEVEYDSVFAAADVTYTGLMGEDVLIEPGGGVDDGVIEYGLTRIADNEAEPVSGTLITIGFTVDPAVSHILEVNNVILMDENNENITNVDENNGQVTIPVGDCGRKGDFNGDGYIDFYDFVMFGLEYNT